MVIIVHKSKDISQLFLKASYNYETGLSTTGAMGPRFLQLFNIQFNIKSFPGLFVLHVDCMGNIGHRYQSSALAGLEYIS